MSAKGRTRWIPRSTPPIRIGTYECRAQISRSLPCILFDIEWDGVTFHPPCPMIIHHWRGLTEKARAALSQGGGA